MGREFELRDEYEIDATPEQVWDAIATGPGIDSWFLGHNEVEPGEGGSVSSDWAGLPRATITAWEPLHRLAYSPGRSPDGRFLAYEFLIEGRAGGSTVLRTVTSGFLPGDDWEAEYEAMAKGGEMFGRTLVEYLTHFRDQTATPITAFGPTVADWDDAWATLGRAMGLTGRARGGDAVRFTPEGLPPVDGVVYFANEHTLGVRTGDALYRFLRGFHGAMVASHHVFAEVDEKQTTTAWQDWLIGVLA